MKLTLPPALRLDWGVIAARLGLIALTAILPLLTQHGLPREIKDYLALCAAILGAMIAALPSALQAAGLKRPISPEFATLCQRLGALLSRPGVRREDVQDAVSTELRTYTPELIKLVADEVQNRTNMQGFSPAELGGVKSAPTVTVVEAPAAPTEAVADAPKDAAVAQTGGNQ